MLLIYRKLDVHYAGHWMEEREGEREKGKNHQHRQHHRNIQYHQGVGHFYGMAMDGYLLNSYAKRRFYLR